MSDNISSMTYTFIDHTADLGIHVFGSDETDLFTQAGLAMFDVITDSNKLEGSNMLDVYVTGDDWPDLMVNWLRELLYLWVGKELLVRDVDIVSISEHDIKARAFVDSYDANRHVIKKEVKAVTYHQITVHGGPSGWEAKIIFDV